MPIDEPLEDDEMTDSVPKVSPAYTDAEMRDLGERLAALYVTRDSEPTAPVAEEIARIRAKMRRGPRLHAGEFLKDGRYRLLERLSSGSSGDAYWKAFDRTSNELVFVRVFTGEWVDDAPAVEAFVRRGDRLAQLRHSAIGTVLDAGRSDDGFVFLATQLFEGGSLDEVKLQPLDVLQVAVELAQGLGHAHEIGVVHGDVRPSNVMLSEDGAARVVGWSVGPAGPGDLASLFRAPETTERGYVPRPTADVYALGMVVVQALNGGDLPFWVLRDPGRLIRQLPVAETVKAVVSRATEWDLGVRYADTPTFLRELLADPDLVSSLAERARSRGRYVVAAEHFEALLRIQPNRAVEIRRILGEVYTGMEAFDKAFVHLLGALERTPDVESLFEPLRVVAGRTGDWARLAEALWTQARARDAGRRVVLRIELARINQDALGNPTAAAETWTQVLADHRTPEQAALALSSLQALARARNDWRGFVEYGRELLSYLPGADQAKVEYALGRAYLENLQDEDLGLAFIDRAETKGHTEPDLAARLQVIRAKRGQWQRVIRLMMQQASSQEIGEASPTLLRAGIIASSVHLEEEAFRVYHALLERAPRHVVALRHLARLHHRAHEHDKATRYYERLWETYRGKDSEEPEASERAADCCAYALLLLKRGLADDATERLDEALRLNHDHVPSLQLAGPLFLGKGDTARAGVVFDRLLSLFKSVELSPQKIEACIGMGDLAWIQGRLTAAMGWYNRALELDPFSVPGWWGLAKVALSSRGGHPGADRAPWVMAMPKRFTGHEALARLLCGVLGEDAMKAWLVRTPLGKALVEGGDTALRLACAVVDVMARNEVIAPDLFQRLGEARPEWTDPVDEVQRLWFGGGASTFPVARSYGWTARALGDGRDFDPLATRTALPTELAPPPVAVEALRTPDAWRTLLAGALPPAPEPFTMIERREDSGPPRHDGPVGALVRDGALWLSLRREQVEVSIGTSAKAALRLVEDPAIRERHARLFRQAGRVYVESVDGGRLQVDGEDRRIWRLVGGERVTLGDTRLQYQAFDDESRLPPPARIAAIGWMEEQHGLAPADEAALRGDDEPPPGEVTQPLPPAPAEPSIEHHPDGATARGTTLVPDAQRAETPAPAPEPEPEPAAEPAPDPSPAPDATPTAPVLAPPREPEPEPEPVDRRVPAQLAVDLPEVLLPADVVVGTDDPTTGEVELDADPPSEEEVVEGAHAPAPVPLAVPPDVEEAMSDPGGDPGPVDPPPSRVFARDPVDDGPIVVSAIPPEEVPEVPELAPQTPIPAWLKEALEAEDEAATAPAEKSEDPDNVPTVVAAVLDGHLLPGAPPVRPRHSDLAATFDFGMGTDDEIPESKPAQAGRAVVGGDAEPSTPPTSLFRSVGPPTSAPPAAALGSKPVRIASLEFMSGPERGRRVEVGNELTVGQGSTCGMSIPSDNRLSLVHCTVERMSEGFVLRDAGSTHGTVVNGQRVTEIALTGGEVIMVGRTVLRFQLEDLQG